MALSPPLTDDETGLGPIRNLSHNLSGSPGHNHGHNLSLHQQSMQSLEHITPNTSPFHTSRSNMNSSRQRLPLNAHPRRHKASHHHHKSKHKNSYTFSDSSPLTSTSEGEDDLENDNFAHDQLEFLEAENNAAVTGMKALTIQLENERSKTRALSGKVAEREGVIKSLTKELQETETTIKKFKIKFTNSTGNSHSQSQSHSDSAANTPRSNSNSPSSDPKRYPDAQVNLQRQRHLEEHGEMQRRLKAQDDLLNLLKSKMGVRDEVSTPAGCVYILTGMRPPRDLALKRAKD